MRILVVGATGTMGSAVVTCLRRQHEVIEASRRGDVAVDLTDRASIVAMYEELPRLDAVVSAAGDARFGMLNELSEEDFAFGLHSKLIGQVSLVTVGTRYVQDNGSFTLTSGILAQRPGPGTSMVAMVNAGVEGFARAAALELRRGQRINVVSPPLVRETAEEMGWGAGGMPAAEAALWYVDSVEGGGTGGVLPRW